MTTRTLIPVEEYLTTVYRPNCDYVDGEVLRFYATAAGDLHCVHDSLRTANPILEVPLSEIFE